MLELTKQVNLNGTTKIASVGAHALTANGDEAGANGLLSPVQTQLYASSIAPAQARSLAV